MLDTFYSIVFEKKDAPEEVVELEDQTSGLPIVSYEDNTDFNDWLDDKFPLEGRLIYSKALYELYYEDYVIQLEEFRDNLGGEV